MSDDDVTSSDNELLLWKIRNLNDKSGKFDYIALKTMNLNLGYQYVSVIFNVLKEKIKFLNFLKEANITKRSLESKLEEFNSGKKTNYSTQFLNKKILNNKKNSKFRRRNYWFKWLYREYFKCKVNVLSS